MIRGNWSDRRNDSDAESWILYVSGAVSHRLTWILGPWNEFVVIMEHDKGVVHIMFGGTMYRKGLGLSQKVAQCG